MEERSVGKFFLWLLVASIGLLLLLSISGCASSNSYKQDQLICIGFCASAEISAEANQEKPDITKLTDKVIQ